MFLEPIYLNETMLFNCASYLFGSVVLNKEETTNNTNDNKSRGSAKGSAGSKLGISLFSDLINANGELEGELERSNLLSSETKVTHTITLGAVHQSVIEELSSKNFIRNLDSKNIHNFKHDNKYIKIKATLIPVDYFEILQILKLVVPQLKNFFDFFGSKFLGTDSKSEDEVKELEDTITNAFQLITDLVTELENTYLESNQLEMLMLDDDSDTLIGVLDINISNKNSNEIKKEINKVKAKLTDGNFIVIGKVTKFAKKGEYVNLLQRSLLSTIFEKIDVILNYFNERSRMLKLEKIESFKNKIITSDKYSEDEKKEMIKQFEAELNESTSINLREFKENFLPELNKLFLLRVNGHAVRIKAMSVCM